MFTDASLIQLAEDAPEIRQNATVGLLKDLMVISSLAATGL